MLGKNEKTNWTYRLKKKISLQEIVHCIIQKIMVVKEYIVFLIFFSVLKTIWQVRKFVHGWCVIYKNVHS